MIKLALVGCGGMAQYHAMNLKGIADVNVVALVDCNPKASANLKAKFFPEAIEYESYEKLLDAPPAKLDGVVLVTPDRKSTRLNSSHSSISYAVFCLKKKNT